MYSLFCEAKFWTLKNDIQIRNTDFGVLRYYDKKEFDNCPFFEGKKSYCHQRGTNFVLKNKRPLKLKDSLKELEQQLHNNKVVFYDWKDNNILNLFLSSGLIINIGVNIHSKDIYKITFDRFLIGKLLSENICDVVSTKNRIVISYNENQLTLVNYTKPSSKYNLPQKLIRLAPKVQVVELCGPSGRRLDRHLSCNKSEDMILTWWHSTRNEVYPWSPLVKDEDRANIHIYALGGVKLELLCFYQTEYDLVDVKFSSIKPNLMWLIEQKVSKKGEVVIEYSCHEINKKVLKKISNTSIPLQTQICCHNISPDEEKLVLGCIDGSIILFDGPKGITRLGKAAFIPNIVSWHNFGALIVIANERCQFQFFDFALSCLKTQLLSEDVTPSNILDLGSYFKSQPTLLFVKWNKKSDTSCYNDKVISNDGLLLLGFENGPLGVLNLIGGGGLSNNIQNCSLTPDTVIKQYLMWNQSDKALNLLLCLNWNTNGTTCLAGLYHIANYVFRQPFTPEREIQLEAALGTFYSPIRPLTQFVEEEFGNQVHDLTRRFFYHLLRYRLYEKAYCLAIDLGNSDLFIDLYHCAQLLGDDEMAYACKTKFKEFSCLSEYSSNSCCSHSSCSCSESGSSQEDEDEENAILPPLPQVSVKKSKASKVPPLPDLNRHNKLRGSAFFNCSSPCILPYFSNTRNECDSEFSTCFEPQTISTPFNEFQSPLSIQPSKTFHTDFSNNGLPSQNYSHSYEICTSFSGDDVCRINFTPIDPAPKFIDYREQNESKNCIAFQPFNGSDKILENLYERTSPLNISVIQEEERFRKSEFLSRSNPGLNDLGQLNLKSPYVPKNIQFSSNNAHNSYSTSQLNSLDYLIREPQRGNKIKTKVPTNAPSPLKPNYYSLSNITPQPSLYNGPLKNYSNYNNVLLQKPLQFVPNVYPKDVTAKPLSASTNNIKQKVKFSDTVTQILLPDLSKISIEDETVTSHNKANNSKVTKPILMPVSDECDKSLYLHTRNNGPSQNSNFSIRNDQNDEEESNGEIEVIHFGVV